MPCRWPVLLGMICLVAGIDAGGCQSTPRQPGPEAQALATISPADLRDILASLARSHEQKLQLIFYISLPWKGVDAPSRDFVNHMAPLQQELNQEILAWAKAHDLDLTFRFSKDIPGEAQEYMESRQEKVLRSDNRTDLTRDILVQMWADYEWQVSLLQVLLPKVRDPALKAYVEKSLKVHTEGSAEITALLKRFKPS